MAFLSLVVSKICERLLANLFSLSRSIKAQINKNCRSRYSQFMVSSTFKVVRSFTYDETEPDCTVMSGPSIYTITPQGRG